MGARGPGEGPSGTLMTNQMVATEACGADMTRGLQRTPEPLCLGLQFPRYP